MKRKREWTIIKIISALILFAGVLTPVRADVIAEPQDPFYKEHAEECTYVGQYYRVIAVKGAFLYTAPQSAEILGQGAAGFRRVHLLVHARYLCRSAARILRTGKASGQDL